VYEETPIKVDELDVSNLHVDTRRSLHRHLHLQVRRLFSVSISLSLYIFILLRPLETALTGRDKRYVLGASIALVLILLHWAALPSHRLLAKIRKKVGIIESAEIESAHESTLLLIWDLGSPLLIALMFLFALALSK